MNRTEIRNSRIETRTVQCEPRSTDIFGAPHSPSGALLSSCPEKMIVSPVLNLVCPACIHLVSHNPKISMLYSFISFEIFAHLPCSYMVRTFHVASLVGPLVERIFRRLASLRIWLSGLMPPGGLDP